MASSVKKEFLETTDTTNVTLLDGGPTNVTLKETSHLFLVMSQCLSHPGPAPKKEVLLLDDSIKLELLSVNPPQLFLQPWFSPVVR